MHMDNSRMRVNVMCVKTVKAQAQHRRELHHINNLTKQRLKTLQCVQVDYAKVTESYLYS